MWCLMQPVFEVYPVVNGQGLVKFLWQKSVGNYLAITGWGTGCEYIMITYDWIDLSISLLNLFLEVTRQYYSGSWV